MWLYFTYFAYQFNLHRGCIQTVGLYKTNYKERGHNSVLSKNEWITENYNSKYNKSLFMYNFNIEKMYVVYLEILFYSIDNIEIPFCEDFEYQTTRL